MVCERHDFEKPVGRRHSQVCSAGLQLEAAEQMLQTDAAPSRCADEVSADRVGNTRERHELMERLLTTKIVQRQLQRMIHETADFQPPSMFIDDRCTRVGVDPVVIFERRKLGACAGNRRDERAGIRQRMTVGPACADSTRATAAYHQTPGCREKSGHACRPSQTNQESTAIEATDRREACTGWVGIRFAQTVVYPAERQSRRQEHPEDP